MQKFKHCQKERSKLKNCLLFFGILLLTQSMFAQSDCEKLFFKTMQEIETHVKTNGLSSTAADAYILKKNEELKAKNPECFPDDHAEEVHSATQPKDGAIKVDSKNLNDDQIQEMDAKYVKATASCKEELKKNLQTLNKEEAIALLHECALEKVISGM